MFHSSTSSRGLCSREISYPRKRGKSKQHDDMEPLCSWEEPPEPAGISRSYDIPTALPCIATTCTIKIMRGLVTSGILYHGLRMSDRCVHHRTCTVCLGSSHPKGPCQDDIKSATLDNRSRYYFSWLQQPLRRCCDSPSIAHWSQRKDSRWSQSDCEMSEMDVKMSIAGSRPGSGCR